MQRAKTDILAETVPLFAPHIVKRVDTQTDIVDVPLVIQGTDVTRVNVMLRLLYTFHEIELFFSICFEWLAC